MDGIEVAGILAAGFYLGVMTGAGQYTIALWGAAGLCLGVAGGKWTAHKANQLSERRRR